MLMMINIKYKFIFPLEKPKYHVLCLLCYEQNYMKLLIFDKTVELIDLPFKINLLQNVYDNHHKRSVYPSHTET